MTGRDVSVGGGVVSGTTSTIWGSGFANVTFHLAPLAGGMVTPPMECARMNFQPEDTHVFTLEGRVLGIGGGLSSTALSSGGVRLEVSAGAVVAITQTVDITSPLPWEWKRSTDVDLTLETGGGAGVAGWGVGAGAGVEYSLVTGTAVAGGYLSLGAGGIQGHVSASLLSSGPEVNGLRKKATDDFSGDDALISNAVQRRIAGQQQSGEEAAAYKEIVDDVADQTDGPRGMGWDPNDPRGPWQEPSVSGQSWIGDTNRDRQGSDGLVTPINDAPTQDWSTPGAVGGSVSVGGGTSGGGVLRTGSYGGLEDSYSYWNRSHESSSTTAGSIGSGGSTRSSFSSSTSSSHPTSVGDYNRNYDRDRQSGAGYDHAAYEDRRPILLDLDGNGVSIAELGRSTVFLDSDGDGLKNRTAWAGVGGGVLFYDAGNDGKITQDREFVFTEWDPSAKDDMAALRSRFDSNTDGKLTGADTRRRGRAAGLTRRRGSRNIAVSRQGRGKTWLPASSRIACCISAIATSRARPIIRPT